MSLWTPLDSFGRPNLLPGISAYTDKITKEEESSLILSFEEHGKQKCQCCGASITKKMRRNLYVASRWWNACPMCFYTENLDLIPDNNKGRLMYMPAFSQARLNAMLRCFWAVTYFYSTEPENMVLREMNSTVTQEINNLTSINEKSAQVHFSLADPEILSSMLYLVPKEDYEKRHKLLTGIRWYPKKALFSDEIDYWARNDHSSLFPKETNGNISKFMSKYMDSNFAVRNMDD
jgi:hypothetical protein